jgi:hypothetical protein
MSQDDDPASEILLQVRAEKILRGNDARQLISERENTRQFHDNHARLTSERMVREAKEKVKAKLK